MPNVNDPNPHAVFDRWFADHSSASLVRGRGGVADIDRAPMAMEDLRHYFLTIPEARLASCWAACIVDAHAMGDFTLSDLSFALIVVSVRLNGLKYPTETMLMPSITTTQTRVLAQPKPGSAAALRQELGVGRPAAPASPTPPHTSGGSAPTVSGAGWELQADGPLPPVGRKGTDPALLSAISALGPLPKRIRLDGKKFSSFKVSKLIKDAVAMGGPDDLTSFKSADGFRIIHRKAAP